MIFVIEFIILRDNNLEVFMKRILIALFFAMSFVGFTGCTDYEESADEDILKQCHEDPSLPMCQDNSGDDDGSDNPSVDEDL